MSVSWRIENGLVWLESAGPWDAMAWMGAVDASLAHPNFRPGMGLVHDRRGLRLPEGPATREVGMALGFVRSRAARIGKARWAIVVADPANFGVGRMAQMMAEGTGLTIGVFRDLAEAEAWVRQGEDADRPAARSS